MNDRAPYYNTEENFPNVPLPAVAKHTISLFSVFSIVLHNIIAWRGIL